MKEKYRKLVRWAFLRLLAHRISFLQFQCFRITLESELILMFIWTLLFGFSSLFGRKINIFKNEKVAIVNFLEQQYNDSNVVDNDLIFSRKVGRETTKINPSPNFIQFKRRERILLKSVFINLGMGQDFTWAIYSSPEKTNISLFDHCNLGEARSSWLVGLCTLLLGLTFTMTICSPIALQGIMWHL